jgi:DNA-binding NtrC family response regulator
MIVDDDPQILRLLRAMLGPQNVNVLSAPRPSDALADLWGADRGRVDFRRIHAEMDGNKLAERVLKLHPRASILLISGEVNKAPAVKAGQVRFLKKPFFPAELIKLIARDAGGQDRIRVGTAPSCSIRRSGLARRSRIDLPAS